MFLRIFLKIFKIFWRPGGSAPKFDGTPGFDGDLHPSRNRGNCFWKHVLSSRGYLLTEKVQKCQTYLGKISYFLINFYRLGPNAPDTPCPRPPQIESTAQAARRNYPQANPKKVGMFKRCIKWQKSWKMGEKMGKKSIFHWDFSM